LRSFTQATGSAPDEGLCQGATVLTPMTETNLQAKTREEVLRALQRRVESVLDDVLGPRATIGIPDALRSTNCGDSAISLGLQEYLRRRPRYRVAFMGEWESPKRSAARALSSDGVLLFNGGNGLGDVWPGDQREREEWIAAFPRYRVVLAPQSIHFSDAGNMARARRVLGSHPDLTVLCRDFASYRLAKQNFDARVELCPDAAFLLGPLSITTDPTIDLLWLARSDHEAIPSSSPTSVSLPASAEVSDWMFNRPVGRFRRHQAFASRQISRVLRRVAPRGQVLVALNPAIQNLYLRLARSHVLRGVNHLSRARVVVTDRLHGHILCTLLGIPHVVLPNADMKTANFITTWTESTGLVRRCESADEAIRVGNALVGELNETSRVGGGP
jgi:exopolysaccharide biosynthesis predicted pyruvyltransferase EpsI